MSLPAFLSDRNFLQQIDSLHLKEQYVRITILNWKEEPLQQVSGVVTNGSVNLDGSSSMRRSASLSVYLQSDINDLADVDNLFSLNKKCKLQLGIINTVPNYTYYIQKNGIQTAQTINYQDKYGKIVWFPLGLFIMFSAAVSHSQTGVTVTLSLKDKMCLLNGDVGGQIHSAVDFANQDTIVTQIDQETQKEKKVIKRIPVLIFNIIKQLVNHWGNELLSNIIIDFPRQTTMLMTWNGDAPAYLAYYPDSPALFQTREQAREYLESKNISKDSWPRIIRIQPGEPAGRIYTDFTWPEKTFFCNIGDTVTSILDKIVNMFGNYQYYYDVEGHFVFKEKQNYLNTTFSTFWNNSVEENVGNLPIDSFDASFNKLSKPVYNFVNNEFTQSYNNTLNYNNIKNDFIVWGSRTNGNSSSLCRFHLAIDKKPSLNKHKVHLYRIINEQDQAEDPVRATIDKTSQSWIADQSEFNPEEDTEIKEVTKPFTRTSIDWRQQIYYQALEADSMGLDQNTDINNNYAAYYAELVEEFPKIFDLRPWSGAMSSLFKQLKEYIFNEQILSQTGAKEHSFRGVVWTLSKLIYNTEVFFIESLNKVKKETDEYNTLKDTSSCILRAIGEYDQPDKEEEFEAWEIWLQRKLNYNQIFQLCKTINNLASAHKGKYTWSNNNKISTKDYSAAGWIKKLEQNQVSYYLEFIDQNSQLGVYSVNNIGRRLKVVNGTNEKINCVFQPYCPEIIFLNKSFEDDMLINFIENIDINTKQGKDYAIQQLIKQIQKAGYYCYVAPDNIYNKLNQYVGKNPCFEKTRDLLYQFTDINNTISITTLPIYYLQPNTRITVEDNPAGIHGDYIIQSISLPLDVSSTMTINAYKALDKI